VQGTIYRRGDDLLVLAEHDVQDLDRTNRELMQVNRDITNLQRELARRESRLAQLNEQKNEFIGMAAHDLRSPLSVILGFASLMLQYPDLNVSERREMLRLIEESVEDMLNLLDSLLNVSEIESGKLNLKPRDVDLRGFLHRVIRLNRPLAEQKAIDLVLDVPPGPARRDF
jgi:two-component system OmpR family sensor kinase